MNLVLVWLLFTCLTQIISCCTFSEETAKWAELQIAKLSNGRCEDLSAGAIPPVANTKSHKPVYLFTLHNDDPEVLFDWLQYHSYLFSIGNITFLDNKSEDPRVCRLLHLYKYCGLNVIQVDNFANKSGLLTDAMSRYKDTEDAFLLPLDVDEFLVLGNPSTNGVRDIGRHLYEHISMNASDVRNAFDNLLVDGRKYKMQSARMLPADKATCNKAFHAKCTHTDAPFRRAIQYSYFSLNPDNRVWKAIAKTFYHTDGFIMTDAGNHYGLVQHDHGHMPGFLGKDNVSLHLDDYFQWSDLALLHFQKGSFDSLIHQYFRVSREEGFDVHSNATCIGRNSGYCRTAKHILEIGHKRYKSDQWKKCIERSSLSKHEVLSASVNDWFLKYARPLNYFVG